MLVVGIGGSYLGARAAIEFLNHSFYNTLPKGKRKTPQIIFIGNNISSSYLTDVMNLLEDADFSINVISKSGTTTEPAIAFRIFKKLLIEKYGAEEAKKRIYATTDKARGALKTLATEEGYESFIIPDDVGGRYSVLTAVGLLPIAVSGADIDQMMEGAAKASEDFASSELSENAAYQYAVVRNVLYNKGRTIEMLINYSKACNTLQNGGSNYSVKVKEKMKKEFILHLRTSQQIFIHLVNMFKKEEETCLKQSSM